MELCLFLLVMLDRSASMDTPMDKITRWLAAWAAASAMMDALMETAPNAVVGVIAYNHRANLLCEPVDPASCAKFLDDAVCEVSPTGNTSFGPPFRIAHQFLVGPHAPARVEPGFLSGLDRICDYVNAIVPFGTDIGGIRRLASRADRKAILLLSDGHNNGTSPLPAVEELKAVGVEIHTVGVGDDESEVNADLLKEIATLDPATGKPNYRFIRDAGMLVKHFVKVSTRLAIRPYQNGGE